MDDDWVPESCTLPTAEQPLRVEEFDHVFRTHVRRLSRLSDSKLRAEINPSEEVVGNVAALAVRETACCEFFRFTISIGREEAALDIEVPPSATAVLDALATRAESA